MSDEKIVPINARIANDTLKGDQPVPEIVAILKQTLAEAERGELHGVLMIGVTGNGNFMMRWHAECSAASMLGAGTMAHETIKNWYIEHALRAMVDEEPEIPA